MDYAACNVVYVDRNAREDRLVKREDATSTASPDGVINYADDHAPVHIPGAVDENLQTLLGTFSEGRSQNYLCNHFIPLTCITVYVCISGKSCISKLSELNQSSIVELIPTLVLIDIPYEDQLAERPSREVRTPSPSSQLQIDGLHDDLIDQEAYGLNLLQWIMR